MDCGNQEQPGTHWCSLISKRDFMDSSLSLVARAVWTALILHADLKSGHAWPSVSMLARNFKVSEVKIRKAIIELRDRGLVHSLQTRDKQGRQSFWIHAPKWMHPVDHQHPPPDVCFPRPGQPACGSRYANQYPLRTNNQDEQSIEGSGKPEPGWEVLSEAGIQSLAEQSDIPEHITEGILEQIRETGRIDGRRPTRAFIEGRFQKLTQHKNP